MGPPSYVRSVVDRNVVMRRIPVQLCISYSAFVKEVRLTETPTCILQSVVPLFHTAQNRIYKPRYSFAHAQHKHMNSSHNDSLNPPFYQPLYRCISKTFACTPVYKLHQHTKKLQELEVCCVGRAASVSSLTKCVYAALYCRLCIMFRLCVCVCVCVWPHRTAAVKMMINSSKLAGCYMYQLQ
jgi:hypothetical protein